MSLNGEQKTGRVLVEGLDLQVTYAVPSTLVLFSLRALYYVPRLILGQHGSMHASN